MVVCASKNLALHRSRHEASPLESSPSRYVESRHFWEQILAMLYAETWSVKGEDGEILGGTGKYRVCISVMTLISFSTAAIFSSEESLGWPNPNILGGIWGLVVMGLRRRRGRLMVSRYGNVKRGGFKRLAWMLVSGKQKNRCGCWLACGFQHFVMPRVGSLDKRGGFLSEREVIG